MDGYRELGYVLGGGGKNNPDAYHSGLQTVARSEGMLADAAKKQAARMMFDSQMEYRRRLLEDAALQGHLGLNPGQVAGIGMSELGNLQQTAAGLQGFQNMNLQMQARDALAGGDWNTGNAYLAAMDGKPVQLADIKGDTLLGNAYTVGGDIRGPTDVGQGRIGALNAQAANSYASAEKNRALGDLYEDKRVSPGRYMKPSAGGGRAVFQIAEPGGSVRTVVSPDGETYVGPNGALIPLPIDAVPYTSGQGATAMEGQRQLDAVSPAATALLGDADLSNLETATRETSGFPQAMARFAEPVIQRVMPEWNAEARNSAVFMDNIAQELKQVLGNNPRFPQWQETLLRGLVPRPGAVISPEKEVAKARQISGDLLRTIEDAQSRMRFATGKERIELSQDIDRMSRIVRKIQEGPGAPRLSQREGLPQGGPTISPDVDAMLREEGL